MLTVGFILICGGVAGLAYVYLERRDELARIRREMDTER